MVCRTNAKEKILFTILFTTVISCLNLYFQYILSVTYPRAWETRRSCEFLLLLSSCYHAGSRRWPKVENQITTLSKFYSWIERFDARVGAKYNKKVEDGIPFHENFVSGRRLNGHEFDL